MACSGPDGSRAGSPETRISGAQKQSRRRDVPSTAIEPRGAAIDKKIDKLLGDYQEMAAANKALWPSFFLPKDDKA